MGQAARHRFTFAEYVSIEEDSGIKHEFADGGVFARAGGTPAHAAITASVGRLLGKRAAESSVHGVRPGPQGAGARDGARHLTRMSP